MSELTAEDKRRIYEEEKARVEAEQNSAAPTPFLSKKLLISVLCVVIVGFGGTWFAYQQYQLQGLKQKLDEAIGRDLGLTETILNIESESSKMTFAEVFTLCDKSVENRTNLIVELRGLYPEMDYRMKTKLVAYLTHENEFVRAKREFYRKSMEAYSAANLYTDQLKNFPTSYYALDFYTSRVRQLKASLLEKSIDVETSANDFSKAYENMAKEETAIADEARSAGLRFDPIFQKHAKENQAKLDETRNLAQMTRAMATKPL